MKLVVVHVQDTGLREHIDPVILWLLASSRVVVVVVVPDSMIAAYGRSSPSSWRNRLYLWVLGEDRFFRMDCRVSLVLSIHPETPSEVARRYAAANCRRVVLQHGLSDKAAFGTAWAEDPLADVDVIFLAGPIFREGSLRRYQEMHSASFGRIRLVNIGLPKTDELFRQTDARKKVVASLQLNPNLPTVCYAPTFEHTASLEKCGVDIIRTLARLDANIIVKLHHCSLKMPDAAPWIVKETGGKDWRAIVKEMERQYPNVKLAVHGNATPYLIASDVLVSDASGVAYEFVLLNRPIVFFDVPELFEEYGTQGIHYWGRKCGDVVQTVDELASAVRRALVDSTWKESPRRELIDRLVYNPGNATEMAGQAIMSLLD